MASSEKLSKIIKKIQNKQPLNTISAKMDRVLLEQVKHLKTNLTKKYPHLKFVFEEKLFIKELVSTLKQRFNDEEFCYCFDKSFIKTDGGFLYVVCPKTSLKFPVLVSEQKKQGTNDVIIATTGKQQSRGNAIERLGKNVIGLRDFCLGLDIFPFVCFGYGIDFSANSSILDRVSTIASFSKLNQINLYDTKITKRKLGSFYFRQEPFLATEIYKIIEEIALKSIEYYLKNGFIC